MTITIDLPDETVAALIERSHAEGRPAATLAAEAVTERFGTAEHAEDAPSDAETVAGLRRGFDDLDAGRTLSLEDAKTGFETAFTARYTTGEV